ncbi:MAG: GIY-YIG nuclease family protein [Candidatus Methylomirabilales bacterium]
MHYTYALVSQPDKRISTGSTKDLRNRVREHAEGRIRSTAYRRPVTLIYYKACLSADDALRRERFLMTGKGKRYLRHRLTSFFAGIRDKKLERY